jgi:predicted phage-related endonuclease
MINGLYDRAFKFWNDHVVPKEPPQVDESESAAEMLARLYNRADLDLLPSSEEVERLVKMAENQKAFLKVAEDNVRYAENQLKAIIGDHEGVEGEWGRLTWRKTKDRHDIDYKSIVAETAIPTELILKHTRTKPGYRRFLYQPAKKEA